jgi:hypothetical protein
LSYPKYRFTLRNLTLLEKSNFFARIAKYFLACNFILFIFVWMNRQIDFKDFINCFRKQFVFQTGKGGRRISKYYTANNQEQGLKHDKWALMVFIHTGIEYGFTDRQMLEELKIKNKLYEAIKQEVAIAIKSDYPDQILRQKILTKTGLVKNCIKWCRCVRA